jgi:hypothetical protein
MSSSKTFTLAELAKQAPRKVWSRKLLEKWKWIHPNWKQIRKAGLKPKVDARLLPSQGGELKR